ncbi:MAG: polysaccharide deacetylase family protein, partial [bacterium]|nr:polysaccharide deacetylase family protein [bacterium]
MITWINFLHLYQPPTQTREVIDQIVKECYSLIPKLIHQYPKLRLTVNISGSLLELLEKYGHQETITEFQKMVQTGRVELVGSAMYHPILALIPDAEMKHHIELHNSILKKYFGEHYKPRGFFIPEMAYGKNVADVVKKMGFEWIIIDNISFPGDMNNQNRVDNQIKYIINDNGLSVIFRDRDFSRTFPPQFIVDNSDMIEAKSNYLITSHDGELYGHWHKDDKGYYQKAFTSDAITMITVSEYVAGLDKTETIEVRAASWESLPKNLDKHIPYELWNDPDNVVHGLLWDFAHFVINLVEDNKNDSNYVWARQHLDRSVASCAWWWSTGRKLLEIVPESPIC